jgi:hypothetical protein
VRELPVLVPRAVSVDSSPDRVSERHDDVPIQHSLSYRLSCQSLAPVALTDAVPFLRSESSVAN